MYNVVFYYFYFFLHEIILPYVLQDSFDPFSSFSSSGFVSGSVSSAFPSNFTTPNSFNNDKDPFAAFGTGFTSKFVSFFCFLYFHMFFKF